LTPLFEKNCGKHLADVFDSMTFTPERKSTYPILFYFLTPLFAKSIVVIKGSI
jgi:hypothetical protein